MTNDSSPAAAPGHRALASVPPVVLVIAGTLSIQFGGAIAFTIFDDVGAAGATLLRLLLSAVLLCALARPMLKGRSRGDLKLVASFGLTLGVMNLCFYEALSRLPLGVAVTIEFLGPIAVAAALSRRPSHWLWVLLAAAGVLLLSAPWTASASLDPVGLGFALAAAVAWGTYIVLAQRLVLRFRAGDGIALAAVVATLVVLIPGLVSGGAGLLEPAVLGIGLAVALLSSAIPYTTEVEALRRMPARVFSVLMSIEPAVAALAGWLVLSQVLSLRELVAVTLVVAAGIGVMRGVDFAPPAEAAIEL